MDKGRLTGTEPIEFQINFYSIIRNLRVLPQQHGTHVINLSLREINQHFIFSAKD